MNIHTDILHLHIHTCLRTLIQAQAHTHLLRSHSSGVTLLADLQIFHQNVMEAYEGGWRVCLCACWRVRDIRRKRERKRKGRQAIAQTRHAQGLKKSDRKIGMKNLIDVDVPLMTHLGDHMRGELLLEEGWPRVNESLSPRGTQSLLTHQLWVPRPHSHCSRFLWRGYLCLHTLSLLMP